MDYDETYERLADLMPHFDNDRHVCALCGTEGEYEILWYDEARANLHQDCFAKIEHKVGR